MNIIGGFLMALADSVPGVSGGTIAFLLGFYDDFINSLHDVVSKDRGKRKKAFLFLIKLAVGWITGFVLAVLVLTSIFESHIYQVSSLFLGFIIFSIPLVMKEESQVLKGKYWNVIFTLIGIAIVVGITIANPSSAGEGDALAFNVTNALFVLAAGMIAISCMVLPGISGSTILLILGLYLPIMNAIKDLLHLNLSALPMVIVFGIGVLLGIALTVKGVQTALKKARSQTIYMILGLMLGSLFAIVRGPATLDTPQPAMTIETFSIVFFLIGGVVIVGLQMLKTAMTNYHAEKEHQVRKTR